MVQDDKSQQTEEQLRSWSCDQRHQDTEDHDPNTNTSYICTNAPSYCSCCQSSGYILLVYYLTFSPVFILLFVVYCFTFCSYRREIIRILIGHISLAPLRSLIRRRPASVTVLDLRQTLTTHIKQRTVPDISSETKRKLIIGSKIGSAVCCFLKHHKVVVLQSKSLQLCWQEEGGSQNLTLKCVNDSLYRMF